jgi:hypothetical protein
MTQVIQGLFLGSLPLLDGSQTPAKASSNTAKESK